MIKDDQESGYENLFGHVHLMRCRPSGAWPMLLPVFLGLAPADAPGYLISSLRDFQNAQIQDLLVSLQFHETPTGQRLSPHEHHAFFFNPLEHRPVICRAVVVPPFGFYRGLITQRQQFSYIRADHED